MMGIVKADDIYGKTLRPTKNRDNIDKIKNQKSSNKTFVERFGKDRECVFYILFVRLEGSPQGNIPHKCHSRGVVLLKPPLS